MEIGARKAQRDGSVAEARDDIPREPSTSAVRRCGGDHTRLIRALGLQEGAEVTVIIKATEAMIATGS